jgi:hypothetical protein
MTTSVFFAVPARREILSELNALVPDNPFATPAYFEAKHRLGCTNWVIGIKNAMGGFRCGCGAFLRKGKLSCELEITSLPSVPRQDEFWVGLAEFCRKQRVTVLRLNSFNSPPGVQIPELDYSITWQSRSEFVLDLCTDLPRNMSKNHQRNIKSARQAGVEIRRTRLVDAAAAHCRLIHESRQRRRARGESIRAGGSCDEHVVYVETGLGELFQALLKDEIVSSVLVLRTPKMGYYHSAGTSPEGMALGASHFLLRAIADLLRASGAEFFNLGGADLDSGLARFKRGFGARTVPLWSAECFTGSIWRRMARGALG